MKRIIPAMLLSQGRLVKGRSFLDHEDAGNPITTTRIYNDQLADEILLLDIDAPRTGNTTDVETIAAVARASFVPVAAGGGIADLSAAARILRSGADKIVLNTSAVKRPELVTEVAERFGRQAVVISLDFKGSLDGWPVYTRAATTPSQHGLLDVVEQLDAAGAGEFVVTDIDREGKRVGPNIEAISAVSNITKCPVIGHGGVGRLEDFAEVLDKGGAHGVAAGRVFQFADYNLIKVRRFLQQMNIEVRKF